jgi:hypothetical protein
VRFWNDHVLAGVPPAPTGSPRDSEVIREQNPGALKATGMKSATPEQEQVIERFRLAAAQASVAGLAVEEAKNLVIKIIGDAEGIMGTFGKITYRITKDRVSTDWAAVASVYAHAIERLVDVAMDATQVEVGAPITMGEVSAIAAQVAAAPGLYTTTTPGEPRFVPYFKED